MKIPNIESLLDRVLSHITGCYHAISLRDLDILCPLTKEEKESLGDWRTILSSSQAQEYLSTKCGFRVRLFRIKGDDSYVPLLLGRTDQNSIQIIETNS